MELVWKTPAEGACASADQLRAEVDRLSETPLVTRDPHYQLEALAFVHEGSWVASVALRDAAGRVLGGREVTGAFAACRELDVPVALVVSTLLDELREPAPPSEPAAEAAPTPAPAQARRAVGLGAFVTGALGLLPRWALGFGVDVEWSLAWPLVFSASAYLPGSETDAEGRGARGFSLHAGAATCPTLAGQRHLFRLCGSVQVGAAVAKGLELTDTQTSAKPVVLVGGEPQLVLGLTPYWSLQLSLGAYYVPVRPRFHWEIEGAAGGSLQVEALALMARIGIIDFLR
ncbi:MAG TPA: hypothetical protein VFZ61_24895 [Polyangiales bacterium]